MNTIELSRETILGKEHIYYLSKATEEQCINLENAGKEASQKILSKLVGTENAFLIAVGDGMKLRTFKIEDYLYKMSQGNFRCYDMPLEQQQRQSSLVNVCPDTKTCWQSALRAIGYKEVSGLRTPAYYEAFAIIWKKVN